MYETPDFAAIAFLFTTLALAVMAFRILANSKNRRRPFQIFLFVVPLLLTVFGLAMALIYFLARMAGAPASFKMLVNIVDIGGAWFLLVLIGCAVAFPPLYILINVCWEIRGNLRKRNVWAISIVAILFITILCCAISTIHSHLLSNLLFGVPNVSDCIEKWATRGLSLDTADLSCSGRFSVFIRRLSTALGIQPDFTLIGVLVTIAAILQGIDSLLNLYDRFSGKKNQSVANQEKITPLPPMQPPDYLSVEILENKRHSRKK
jgi:hypothetical protein